MRISVSALATGKNELEHFRISDTGILKYCAPLLVMIGSSFAKHLDGNEHTAASMGDIVRV